jgi:hypothetical protein
MLMGERPPLRRPTIKDGRQEYVPPLATHLWPECRELLRYFMNKSSNQPKVVLAEPLVRHKRRHVLFLEDIASASSILASDVAIALAEDIDELSTHSEFRQGLQRVIHRILLVVARHQERISFFNEAIPGFTLMVFKKEPITTSSSVQDQTDDLSGEMTAASVLIAQFFKRTGARVLAVEGVDVVCVFFPTSDVKRNLREMGFFLVD